MPLSYTVLAVVVTRWPATSKSAAETKRVTSPSISAESSVVPARDALRRSIRVATTTPEPFTLPFTSTRSPLAGWPLGKLLSCAVE